MVQMRVLFLIFWAACFGLLVLGCRGADDAADDDDDFVLDAGEFDAGSDDSGPGTLCPDGSVDPFDNHVSPYYGGESAVELEVVSFGSFSCSACMSFAAYAEEIWSRREEFRKRVRFYFHFYTRNEDDAQIHPVAVAAMDQGMEHFWAIHDLIVDGWLAEPQIFYTREQLIAYAEQTLNLDMERFDQVLDSEETVSFLAWENAQFDSAGYINTPVVAICGQKVSPWMELEGAVDAYLGNL